MAATNQTIQGINSKLHARVSIREKLNVQWHERALQLFMVIVLAHWAEHLAQAVQIWVLHWPRPKAGGVLGLWFPWLVSSEVLHYGYALVMLVGIWVLRRGFVGVARKWWTVALVIQFWHHIEHLLLIGQATFHHNLFGSPVPASILQLFVPRVELHLFYNNFEWTPVAFNRWIWWHHSHTAALPLGSIAPPYHFSENIHGWGSWILPAIIVMSGSLPLHPLRPLR
jgi:hypothetical protein